MYCDKTVSCLFSLSLKDDGSARSEKGEVSLVAGMSSGLVCIWTVFLERGR